MSILAKKYFRNEAAAFRHLESLLWPEGPVCPHCGTVDKAGRLEGVRSKPSKNFATARHATPVDQRTSPRLPSEVDVLEH